ncbi:hypothetical protein KCU95_g15500, partial [Aureobasidium melanogenum]
MQEPQSGAFALAIRVKTHASQKWEYIEISSAIRDMAPQYKPAPLLDHAYAAVSTANSSFDSPDWQWSRSDNILDGAYVPYICEAILVMLIFMTNSLCILDHKFTKSLRADQSQNPHAVYEAAAEREFADWRSEWESKFPDLFIGHAICTICFDPIGERELIRGLPCLHVFHKNCMDTWFEALHVTCPLCKQDILKLPSPCYRLADEQV